MLKAVRKLWVGLVVRLRGLGRRGRWALIAVCALVAMGAGWLMLAWPTEHSAGQRRVDRDTVGGRTSPASSPISSAPLAVPADSANPIENPTDLFGSLASKTDIWSTQQQSAWRWQAAKMSALGKLISSFPSVRAASVILEPGHPRSLGSPATTPTAAVTITMADQAPVPASMVQAARDLVCGSVAGMQPQDVRVIDSGGRSCGSATQPALLGGMEQRRQDETYFADKIRQALPHVGALAVGVDVDCKDDQPRCRSVTVLAPQSYLQGLWARQGETGMVVDSAFAQEQIERLRLAVMRVAGIDDPQQVWADWYYDAAVTNASQQPTGQGILAEMTSPSVLIGAGGASLVIAVAAGVALRRRRRRQAMRQLRRRSKLMRRGLRVEGTLGRPSLGQLLGQMSPVRVAALLRDEHPQVVAVAMARLGADQAAAVLGQLDPARQADVAGRLASAGTLAPELVAQIEQALVDRLVDTRHLGPEQAQSHAAAVLSQMPGDGGAGVLAELGRDWPELARTVGARMLSFEQLMDVPAERLAAALRNLDEQELAVALRVAGRELKARVLSCLSAPAGKALRRRLGRLGPVPLGEVELAQQRIVEAVANLDAGQYVGSAKRELLA